METTKKINAHFRSVIAITPILRPNGDRWPRFPAGPRENRLSRDNSALMNSVPDGTILSNHPGGT